MRRNTISRRVTQLLLASLLVSQILSPVIVHAVTPDTPAFQQATEEMSPLDSLDDQQTSLRPVENNDNPLSHNETDTDTSPEPTRQHDSTNNADSSDDAAIQQIEDDPEEPTDAHAIGDQFTIDDIPYQILTLPTENENGTVQVGDGSRLRLPASDTLIIPETVPFSNTHYTTTTIAPNTFAFLKANTVSIPDTIHTIGRRAFARTSLTEITIPDSVVELADGALLGNEKLERIALSASVKHLPDNLLTSSSSLKRVDIPEGVETIGAKAFYMMASLKTVNIPSTVTTIGASAFSLNESLVTVNIPDNSQLTTIGTQAFYFSEGFRTINLPASIEVIGDNAFGYVKNLETIGDLSNSALHTLGKSVFYNTRIRTVAFPQSLTEIGSDVFNNAEVFESVSIDPNNPNYTSDDGVLYDKAKTQIIIYPIAKQNASYTVPSTVTSIADYTFEKNQYLSQITLPEGLTAIGDFAFRYVPKLTRLDIPSSVAKIGKLAIADIDNLEEVVINGNLGNYAIYNNPLLSKITLAESVRDISYYGIAKNPQLKELHIKAPEFEFTSGSFGSISDYDEVNITVANQTVKDQLIEIGLNADNIIIYQQPTNQITVHYLDSNKQAIAPSIILDGDIGTSYQTEEKEIPGYQLTTRPTNASGAFTSAPQEVIYHYQVQATAAIGTIFEQQGVTYQILSLPTANQAGTVQVGDGEENATGDLPSVTIPPSLEFQGNGYNVTEVAVYAFYQNREITSLVLPEGLTKLNEFAIYGNKKLTELRLPNSLNTINNFGISGNKSLQELIFTPASQLTTLGNDALSDNDLERIYLPSGLTAIGENLLFYNEKLNDVTFGDGFSYQEIPRRMFFRTGLTTINLPASIRVIGEEAFAHNQQLNEINLEQITDFGDSAFAYTGLTTLTFSDQLDSLNNGIFFENTQLQQVTFAEGIKHLGIFSTGDPEDALRGVFENNSSLTTISLPASLETIGRNVFKNSVALKEIQLHMDELTQLGANAFYDIHEDALFYVKTQQVKDRLLEEEIRPENIIFFDDILPVEQGSVTISYVDQTGQAIAPSETFSGTVGDSYKTEPKLIDNYQFVSSTSNTTGVYTVEPITVTHTYQSIIDPIIETGSVVIRYLSSSGEELSDTTSLTGNLGDTYKANPLVIPGYQLKDSSINTEGIFTTETIIVNFIYEREEEVPSPEEKGLVTVYYLTTDQEELAPTKVLTGKIGEKYATKAKKINGYSLSETPKNAKGTFQKEPITITYLYQKDEEKPTPDENGQVTVLYVSTDQEELAKPETIIGKIGEKYATKAKDFAGYSLTEIPKNVTGNYQKEAITVTYIYEKDSEKPNPEEEGQVTVLYLDNDKKELAKPETLTGKISEDYKTKAKEIAGYSLTETPKNAAGKYQKEPVTVTYIYEKDDEIPKPEEKGQVTVLYLDKDKKELAKPDTLTGEIGEEYTTKAKKITDYELTETPNNTTGKYQKEPITVTYVYEKTDTKAKPTSGGASTNGTTSKPSSPASGKSNQSLPKTGELISNISHLLLWIVIAQISLLWYLKKRDPLK